MAKKKSTPKTTRKTIRKSAQKTARKKVHKKAASKKKAAARVKKKAISDWSARVRMYRQGLGDCFLLSFSQRGGSRFHCLIDCGVLMGTQNANAKMRNVAQDIRTETGGTIDLLVVTHEHWDHVSGFLQAEDIFTTMSVQQLWLAWTEDPDDDLAEQLRSDRRVKIRQLKMAEHRLRSLGFAAAKKRANGLHGLMNFFGAFAADGTFEARRSTSDALDTVRSLSNRTQPRYLRPGEGPIELPGGANVRVYVLGPPTDLRMLGRSNPTKRGREVYEKMFGTGPEHSFYAALDKHKERNHDDPDTLAAIEQNQPFDLDSANYFERAAVEKETVPFEDGPAVFNGSHMGLSRLDDEERAAQFRALLRDNYFGRGNAAKWRRIDDDWLGVAEELALKLDSDTNNTSLVLAFELIDSGKVLLFPGDAQVGNWLSWHDPSITWTLDGRGQRAQTISARDLLARTVVYKVGHHGSHNATLRDLGLELMKDPDLVAMIPVDESLARSQRPYEWKMPFEPLRLRLAEKTKGRVIRADKDQIQAPPDGMADGLSSGQWTEFTNRVHFDELFVDYLL